MKTLIKIAVQKTNFTYEILTNTTYGFFRENENHILRYLYPHKHFILN